MKVAVILVKLRVYGKKHGINLGHWGIELEKKNKLKEFKCNN